MTFLDPFGQSASPRPGPLPLSRTPFFTGPRLPPIDPQYQRNLTTLTNKYRELSPVVSQLPEHIRTSLINFDSRRVSQGTAPLTREQTALAIQAALSNQQATPEPDRNPLSVLSNFGADLNTILKSIPRLPIAAFNELQEIPRMGQFINEAQQQGANPLEALLQAPGIRLIPGTYTASNILGGNFNEALSHPLFTALDVLPIASVASGATRVGRLAAEGRAAKGLRPRPISGVLTNRLDQTGQGLQRNTLGQLSDTFRQQTAIGQALESFGGQMSRDVARIGGKLDQRLKSLMLGHGRPGALNPADTTIESFGPRIAQIFEKYETVYPSLRKDAFGPEHDKFRAELYHNIQRNPEQYDPGFVNELRDLQLDFARFHESQGLMGTFDNEWYPIAQHKRLTRSQQLVQQYERMQAFRNEYLTPSGNLTTGNFAAMVDDVLSIERIPDRLNAARGFEATLDAYGIEVKAMKGQRSALHRDIGSWSQWASETRATITNATNAPPTPRRSMADISSTLRSIGADNQAAKLDLAFSKGLRNETTNRLKNLYDRKPPTFPDQLYPQFRDDVRSMSRRVDFDNKVGSRYTDKRVLQRQAGHERLRDRTAPASFQGLLADETLRRVQQYAELQLGRILTPEEAGQFAAKVEAGLWNQLPGIDPADAADFVRTTEREVTETWRMLRDNGHNPLYVHVVTPRRIEQTLTGKIGPVPQELSQVKERAINLTPGGQDLQVSLTHQASELLSRHYSELFIEQVIDAVGLPEAALREQLFETAYARSGVEPSLTTKGHLEQDMLKRYEKFNPDTEGFSWGGARLDKYRTDAYFIPKSIANNLHRYAKRPSITSTLFDPINKVFRYNVIGLSPSVIINNFFSNSVAMMAEVGPRPLKYFSAAREWIANPSRIPNEELKAMVLAETPHMEHLNREQWLASRTGQKFMASFNAANAFRDSAASTALKSGKRGLDQVVTKSLRAQQWGDNVYRAMTYMDQVERGIAKGATKEAAEHAAMELVRRTFVDYASFTPIERSAMRTIIPFYSYMGHAARFIARYPLDHPLRASIASKLAAAEKERLGAMPGSFLSMWPIGGVNSKGQQQFFNLRPFDPFGDTADLVSVAGWVSAMNPAIQTALRQVGVIRGEAELYPTLRYDPQSGRMKAVHGNFISDLFYATAPRVGLATTILGLNPDYNELRVKDRNAANRMLVGMAGIPRAWRQINVPQEQFKGEVARGTVARDVLNEATRSGNWREAPAVSVTRGYYDVLKQLPEEQVRMMTPETQQAVAEQIGQLT